MVNKKVLITGSCGLVGSTATKFFANIGFQIIGIDNNQRKQLFGKDGSTEKILEQLKIIKNYEHNDFSITDKLALNELIKLTKPSLIIHCAAQPSHEKSAEIPFEDFMINAVGTINLLEVARVYCPESPFIFLSTNKVYGDNPNLLSIEEKKTRYDFTDCLTGISEELSIDQSLHSPFGVSKLSADLVVQEYGKYYRLPTVCFRCGCITGENQQGVEQHGFLSYLCRSAKKEKPYVIYGYKGKQVRDNIHAYDLSQAFYQYYLNPKYGEVYNIGGGKENSVSILESIKIIEDISGLKIKTEFRPERRGDHVCYYTNMSKFKEDYPNWQIENNLEDIFRQLLSN